MSNALPALWLAVLLSSRVLGQSYVPTDLDPGQISVTGNGIALVEEGPAVGSASIQGIVRAARFLPARAVLLPMLAGDANNYALDANAAGTIVGAETSLQGMSGVDSPRIWSNGTVANINSLVTTPTALVIERGDGINGPGTIVGTARLAGQRRAYRLDSSVLTDLGALVPASAIGSSASKINDQGIVAGSYFLPGLQGRACRWDQTGFYDLHDPNQIAGSQSGAVDIDRFGRSCGYAEVSPGLFQAVLFAGSSVIPLGALGPTAGSFANGMNDLGVCVGHGNHPSSPSALRALRYQGGVVEDLNALLPAGSGWFLQVAFDVDNAGRIVGFGLHGGVTRPFLLTPNCAGGFTVTSAGCPGSGALPPALAGKGCPTAGAPFGLEWSNGPAAGSGLLFIGTGAGSIPVVPGCALAFANLVPVFLPISLDAAGGALLPIPVPVGVSGIAVTFQSLITDGGAPFGVAGTPGLTVVIP